jgi:hypothetical protein
MMWEPLSTKRMAPASTWKFFEGKMMRNTVE